jgi:hypothetical protein
MYLRWYHAALQQPIPLLFVCDRTTIASFKQKGITVELLHASGVCPIDFCTRGEEFCSFDAPIALW